MNKIAISGLLLLFLLVGIIGYWFFKRKEKPYGFNQKATKTNLELLKDKKNIIPIAILGSGPAGLSAGIYGARSTMHTVIFQGPKPGGQLTETSYVENWPGVIKELGVELINKTQKQAERFGAAVVSENIKKVDLSSWPFKLYTEDDQELNALSLILATGSKANRLNVPGEDKYWGTGVSPCAICDAPQFKNKSVVVIGGGDSAVEEATLLASYAKDVKVFVRKDQMRAAPTGIQRLKQYKNIEVLYNREVKEMLGTEDELTSVKVYNNKTKETYNMPIDGVFLAIGHTPNTKFLEGQVSTDKNGYIEIAPHNQSTSVEGVYSAGDVSDPKFKQAGVAAGDGIKAALQAVEFLEHVGFDDAFAESISKNYYEPYDDDQELKEIKDIASKEELDKLIKESKDPVIVDLYGPMCISCMEMLPILQRVAAKYADEASFVKVDISKAQDIREHFKVKSVPQLLVFKDGKQVATYKRAFTNTSELIRELQNYIYS